MNIPDQWTFKSADVADGFDAHVREQLPWYDLATKAVAHLGRHYIPRGGLVYDIGASTGNIGRALADTITSRAANLIAIEESPEMAARYSGPPTLIVSDALTYEFEMFDFAVAFLAMMFFPVASRTAFLNGLISRTRPGGALVIVDKLVTPPGYCGTALRRLAMSWKLDSGTPPDDVVRKELSLAGYQRPLSPNMFHGRGEVFFMFGEFIGWICERNEA